MSETDVLTQIRFIDRQREAEVAARLREEQRIGQIVQMNERSGLAVSPDGQLLNQPTLSDSSVAPDGTLAEQAEAEEAENEEAAMADMTEQQMAAVLKQEQRQAETKKEALKGKAEEALLAPAQQGASKLLQQYWLNLIDSFGLTTFLIDLHVGLRYIFMSFDKVFCKLGEEWLPPSTKGPGSSTPSVMGMPGDALFIPEAAALGILNLAWFCVIALNVAVTFIIIYYLNHPLEAAWDIVKAAGAATVSAITAKP